MDILWTISEQQAIKPISKNRVTDFSKLAEEVQIDDLQPLMGFDFFQDMVQNPTSEWNAKLLDGGTYTYNGRTYIYSGLKYALAYFLYARHIGVSNEFDTFSGLIEKNLDDSRHADLGIVKNRQNAVKKTAFTYWEDCQRFVIANISNFPMSMDNPIGSLECRKKTILYL